MELPRWQMQRELKLGLDPDLSQNGYGGIETQCHDKNFPEVILDPEFMTKFQKEQKIGPVINVRVVRIVGEYGLEVAVPSIRDYSTTSWVLISRGRSGFADGIR